MLALGPPVGRAHPLHFCVSCANAPSTYTGVVMMATLEWDPAVWATAGKTRALLAESELPASLQFQVIPLVAGAWQLPVVSLVVKPPTASEASGSFISDENHRSTDEIVLVLPSNDANFFLL
eukprot:SAG11_NODE_13339_length_659_cov_1.189286_1_plen_122_part_00